MRRIEYQDADEQYLHAQTIPKAFGFEAATQSTQDRSSPSLRDEAATRSINDNRDEAATQTTEKKGDLKKQSQFVPGLSNATSYLKGDYDKFPAGRAEENKANSKPNTGLWPETRSTKH